MSTVTIQAEDYFIESLHAYALSVGKGVSQAVKDALTPIIVGHSKKEPFVASNPWEKFYGCVPKDETRALKAYISEQDVVNEESWK